MTAAARRTPVPADVDPFVAYHQGLVQVHHAILGSFHALVAAAARSPRDVVIMQARAAAGFLRGHHEAETRVLFPALARLARGLSAEASFLDDRAREHRGLHALAERLVAAAGAPHPAAPEMGALAGELVHELSVHVTEEETGLSPERLRAYVDAAALEQIGRDLEDLRRSV